MDYEIIFDGTHQNADRDLLCCDRIIRKRYDAPEPREVVVSVPPTEIAPVRAAVEACLHRGDRTCRELETITGFSVSPISAALRALQRDGQIRAIGISPTKGRGAMRYRWIGDEA